MATAWAWLKRNWYWVVLPVGILLVLLRLLRRRRGVLVVHDTTRVTDSAIVAHDAALVERERVAEAHEAAELKRIEVEHAATLEALNASQRLQYETLKHEGSKAVTSWLLRVGRGEE